MKKWLRRIRGAVVMGLTWAAVWAPVAVLLGVVVDPDGSMDEMWVAIGGYAGFLGGVVFGSVLGILGRRRRFDELSLPRFIAWGAIAGFVAGALPFAIGEPTNRIPLWLLGSIVIGSLTLLSALSAAGSLMLARMSEKRQMLQAGAAMDELQDGGQVQEAMRAAGDSQELRAGRE
jgi:hypothetical protein